MDVPLTPPEPESGNQASSLLHSSPQTYQRSSEAVQRSGIERYLAALVVTSVAVPIIMTAVSLAVYISWGNWPLPGMTLVLGVFGGVLGWILLTLVAQHFITIERANPALYRELHSRAIIGILGKC